MRATDDLMHLVYVESREDYSKSKHADFQPAAVKKLYETTVKNLNDKTVTFTVIKHNSKFTIAEEIMHFAQDKNAWALTMGYIGQNQFLKNTNKLRAESDTAEMGSTVFQAISNPTLNVIVARFSGAKATPFERKMCVAFKNVERAKTAFRMCLHMTSPEEEVRVVCSHFGRVDDNVEEAKESFRKIKRDHPRGTNARWVELEAINKEKKTQALIN